MMSERVFISRRYRDLCRRFLFHACAGLAAGLVYYACLLWFIVFKQWSPDTSYSQRYVTVSGHNIDVYRILPLSLVVPLVFIVGAVLSAWFVPAVRAPSKRGIQVLLIVSVVAGVICWLGYKINFVVEG